MTTPKSKLSRFIRHTFVWRPSYARVFSADCLNAITAAVKRCEVTADVQVCVIAEHTLPYSYLRKNLATRDRAITLFGKHRVWDTQHNTGVLIYINWVERVVELVADRGVTGVVAQQHWDNWAQQIRRAFSKQQFQSGIVAAIEAMSPVFAAALPTNELVVRSVNLDDVPIVL